MCFVLNGCPFVQPGPATLSDCLGHLFPFETAFPRFSLSNPPIKETGGVTLPRPARSPSSKKPLAYRAGFPFASDAATAAAADKGLAL